MKIRLFFLPVFFLVSLQTIAQSDWIKITSVDEVCAAYPEQIKSIFLNLNLKYPGLDEVSQAYASNNIPLACLKLLDYYAKSSRIPKDLPATAQKNETAADSVLQDIYTFQRVSDKVPRLANGHLRWNYTGPEKDIEWAWALNRNYPTNTLLHAFAETGNTKYVPYIDQFTKDWITSSWPYPAVKSNTTMWRGLEVSFRVKIWSQVFFELWNTNLISPATKLLILSSLPDHAHYTRNFHAQGNWLTMEISGLATVASSWPEFKDSPAWLDYSVKTMVASMKEQVYPDGVQTELTSSYHAVALSNFNLFAGICMKNRVALPEYYTATLEAMFNYLALTMRPDGYGLLNNDADQINNRRSVIEAAGEYHRPDWIFIATNGKEGSRPDGVPSCLFPYAGQLISRSDYGSDAHYSFFDIGPWGTGHQHNDKLHISVSAFGRDFLVDAGRFAYRGATADKFRKYATGSWGHNLVIPDGKGEANGIPRTETPLSEDLYLLNRNFDYGSGTFDRYTGLEGSFSQTRAMVYVRGKFWVVADKLKTDRPRTIQTLWHWHPDNQVKVLKSGITASQNERGNLQIIPAGNPGWNVSMVKGQEKPDIQGWYSREYNTCVANPTTIYSRQLKADETFVWVFWPSEDKAPAVRAKILGEDAGSVKVQVTGPGKESWIIVVPFMNSKKVKVEFLSNKQR